MDFNFIESVVNLSFSIATAVACMYYVREQNKDMRAERKELLNAMAQERKELFSMLSDKVENLSNLLLVKKTYETIEGGIKNVDGE